jgi:beta-lactamase regulating signal transducer with metallopeptidase domain
MTSMQILDFLYKQSLVGIILFTIVFLTYSLLVNRTAISLYPGLWLAFLSSMLLPIAFLDRFFPQTLNLRPTWIDMNRVSKLGQNFSQGPSVANVELPDSLFLLWVAGTFVSLILFIVIPLIRQQRLLSQITPIPMENSSKLELFKEPSVFHLSKNIVIYKDKRNEIISSPFVCGFLFPKLFIPTSFIEENECQAIKGVLLHEEAHAVRCDNLKKLIARMIVCLFWFLPFMYVALYFFTQSQEIAADNFALTRLNRQERLSFAKAMAALALKATAYEPFTFRTAFENTNHITRRLFMIQKYRTRSFLSALLPIATIVGASFAAHATMKEDIPINLKISGQITENGKLLSSPTIIVNSGSSAKIVVGDKEKVIIMEMVATYYEPSSASVDILWCKKENLRVMGDKDLDESCDGVGNKGQARAALDVPFQIVQGGLEFGFEIAKVKLSKVAKDL